jgi:lipopolysaccharide export system protein LptA
MAKRQIASLVALCLALACATAGLPSRARSGEPTVAPSSPKPEPAATDQREPPKKEPAGKDAPGKKEPAKKPPEKKPPVPIHIWGDHISYLQKENENVARITGNATVIRDDMRIDAHSIRATFDPVANRLRRVIATDDVRMHTVIPITQRTTERPPLQLPPEGRKAFCELLVYDAATNTVTLYGSRETRPRAIIGKDQLEADAISYDRTKQIMTFEGSVRISAEVTRAKPEATPPTPPTPRKPPATPTPPKAPTTPTRPTTSTPTPAPAPR